MFKQFLYDFHAEGRENETDSKYIQMILHLIESNDNCLNVDCGDLRAFPTTEHLYDQLVHFPSNVIPIFDFVTNEVAQELSDGHNIKAGTLHVRLFNLAKKQAMRDLSTENINQLVCIEGMITRVGDLIPDLRVALFRCSVCRHEERVNREGYRIDRPERCPLCRSPNSLQLLPNDSLFVDKQLVKMQEVPDAVPQGETPQAVTLYAHEELFDAVRPGDRVEVTGVFRAVPIRVHQRATTVRDVFRTFIDVLHYQRKAAGRVEDAIEVGAARRVQVDSRGGGAPHRVT